MHQGVTAWVGSLAVVMAVWVAAGCGAAPQAAQGAVPWTSAEALAPADLVKALGAGGRAPTIVYVGFRALYHPGHIPGASFHGPASEPGGLEDLRRWAATLPKDAPLVIYCGCCPFDQCPNVVPAYRALRDLGFTKVRVLMLPTSFATDWVDKGYPVER